MEDDFFAHQEDNLENKKTAIYTKYLILWATATFGFLNTLFMTNQLKLGLLFGVVTIVLWAVYGFLLVRDYRRWNGLFFVVSSVLLAYDSFNMTAFTLEHFTPDKPVGYRGYFFPLFFIFSLLILRTILKMGRLFSRTILEDEEISVNHTYDTDNFNVPDYDTLIIAGILTNVFYLLFTLFPADPISGSSWLNVLREKFVERGIIPILTTWIFFWALVILYLKMKRIIKERKTERIVLDRFPNISVGTVPNSEEISDFLSNKTMNYQGCIFHKRLSILMDLMDQRDRKKTLDDIFASQAELERNMIASSHTSLRFIIWAIPILGFLGTVWGISLSVSELTVVLSNTAASAVQIATPETSFGNALGGLGIAFDTTVVALSLSVIAMLLASYVRKIEDEQVTKAELFFQHL